MAESARTHARPVHAARSKRDSGPEGAAKAQSSAPVTTAHRWRAPPASRSELRARPPPPREGFSHATREVCFPSGLHPPYTDITAGTIRRIFT
jgi:hypothetical protein